MKRYSSTNLQQKARERPLGLAAHLLKRGTVVGDLVFVDDAADQEIRRHFAPPARLIFPVSDLMPAAAAMPGDCAEFILAQGRKTGETVQLTERSYRELILRCPSLRSRGQPPVPTLAELTANFGGAMAAWAKAGFQTVPREVFEHRQDICGACEHWQADARLGLGRCGKCGCSRFKLWLATSKCPDRPSRW